MENNTDQKPNDDSVQPAEVEGVEVAQAPVTEDETSQVPAEQEQAGSGEQASDKSTDGAKEAPTETDEPGKAPAPLQPVVHKSGAPIFAIIAAVVVAIGLAGITVYAYMQTQKDTTPAASQTTTEDTSATDSQEVDDTSKEIDKALEASEETDFPDSELSDQNLNL